jgi:Flp pilus assembly protein TadG
MRCCFRIFGEKGQMVVIFGILLPVFAGMATLSVELGYVYLNRNKLQIAADAAALAAVRDLVQDNLQAARDRAVAVAATYTVAGKPVWIDPVADVTFGRWESGTFTPTETSANAVRVRARRNAEVADHGIPLYFGPIIGISTVDVVVYATATLANIDLLLVIDRSGSMDDDTQYQWQCCWHKVVVGGVQPMDMLRTAAKQFISDLDSDVDQVGVVSYSTSASNPIERMLTQDFNAARQAVDNIPQPNGWTHIGDGIDKAITELRSDRARGSTVKIILLLSDGAPTCNSSGSCGSSSSYITSGRAYALQKAGEANGYNFIVHTVSLGQDADRTLMQQIAQSAGGSEFYAATGADLSQVFASVRQRIPVRLVK